MRLEQYLKSFCYPARAQPDDVFGDPSFLISVRTSNGDQIEPIDSLQILFNAQDGCDTTEDNPSSIDVVQENWFTFSYIIKHNKKSTLMDLMGRLSSIP